MYLGILLFAILTPTSLAIYDGSQVDLTKYHSEYKFFVSILYNDKPFCSGVIYSREMVLTTAYCVYVNRKNLTIQFIRDDTTTDTIKVDGVTLHPDFNVKTFENDIAILSVKLTDDTRNIQSLGCGLTLTDVKETFALGIGVDHIGGPLKTLPHKINLREVSAASCKKSYQNIRAIAYGMRCYDQGMCSGDEGGPIMVVAKGPTNVEKKFLFAVSSWAYGCGVNGYPSVFTDICKYDDFIPPRY